MTEEARTYIIEHRRVVTAHTPKSMSGQAVEAWVHAGIITDTGTEYDVFRAWVNEQGDDVETGTYRVLEQTMWGYQVGEWEITARTVVDVARVQHGALLGGEAA